MNYIGVDPGKSGCVALIKSLGYGTIPTHHFLALKKATERDVWEFVSEHIVGWRGFAVVEKVHSSPQMGVVSAFTFGRSYGFLRGALIASGVAFDEVSPQTWQACMGCRTKGDKNVSKAKAQQLFPSLKITHANADALLLAEYCRRTKV